MLVNYPNAMFLANGRARVNRWQWGSSERTMAFLGLDEHL